MLIQYAVDYPKLALFPPIRGMLSRKDKPPDIWDTHGMSGNVFVNPPASSSSLYPGGFNPWISNVTEHTSPHVTSERQTQPWIRDASQDRQPDIRPQVREDFQRIMEWTNKDCRFRIFILSSSLIRKHFPNPETFACWKIRFKTEVCICSQFPTEATLWIKVEMVDSVDDLKSSCSVRGIRMPDFEVLDAKIASALNRIIHNTRFKRKVSLE